MPKATRFRIRPSARSVPAAAAPVSVDDATGPTGIPPQDSHLAAIRREGLSARQLRLARRLAEKSGMTVTSDLDAVRQLRAAGITPFGGISAQDIATAAATARGEPAGTDAANDGHGQALATVPDGVKLPRTIDPAQLPSPEVRTADSHAAEIARIQRDITRRRQRRLMLLWSRLAIFVGLPTLLAAIYYGLVATPMYATHAEFVIQQAEPAGAGGLGGLFSGTQFATSQDSIAVQGYLQSREAMLRLDESQGFRGHFADPAIDPLQRLEDPASIEDAYKIYRKYVKISYDQTEGIIKMEVSAPDAALSAAWSRQLIAYAEEQVNQLSERLRADQMKGANDSYTEAEAKLLAAQERVVILQEQNKVLSSAVEVTLLTNQITALETQLTQERLALAQMLANPNPNRARVDPVQRRVTTLENEIELLRARLTEDGEGGRSLARVQSELLVAEADVQTRRLLLTQAAQQLESARIEANRQQRYLSLSVAPVAPDLASYPRTFENTLVAMLIFAGIYLMLALTAAILREQVTR